MELLIGLLVLGHALLGILFYCGLLGRFIVLWMAEHAPTIQGMQALAKGAAPFEWLVIRVGAVALLLGLATAIAQGRPFLGPLQGAPFNWLSASILLLLTAAPLPALVFLPKGRVFEAALEEASARGEVTSALRAAWSDRATRAAHAWELGVVSAVLLLMFAKPF